MAQVSTQSFIPVQEIRDGILIKDDGVLCAILLVSTLNFELKSDEEREAILFQFRNLLNSLEVGIQILIQSRRLNIRPYLEYLTELKKGQNVELLRLQTEEYIRFIKAFTEQHDIMSKQFFVVVTYSPVRFSGPSLPFFKKKNDVKEDLFEENKTQLLQRTKFIQNTVRALGLRVVQLGTDEVIELLYQNFNPGDTQSLPTIQ